MPETLGPDAAIRAWAPGRVNLIGEHTDYIGGLAVPMAIDLGTTIVGRRVPDEVELRSDGFPGTVHIPLDVSDPASVEPPWGRYVAGVISVLRPRFGIRGAVTTTIPVGTGLSSSAALELAVAMAVGADGSPLEVALACQQAEQTASGVPCGVMDQLTSAAGVAGHVLLIDFASLHVEPVPVPAGVDVVVVPSGQQRELAGSAYAERRAQLEAAEREIGPLRTARRADVERLTDPVTRARARHVVTENERVRSFVEAFRAGDLAGAGALMIQAHASFRDDFAASTPVVDALVERLVATPGVHGARLTGGGFGGCAVALTEPGVLHEGWTVQAAAGAHVEALDG
ncbi:MAG TPA: galactokinase [Acidimicrobiales bacterium]